MKHNKNITLPLPDFQHLKNSQYDSVDKINKEIVKELENESLLDGKEWISDTWPKISLKEKLMQIENDELNQKLASQNKEIQRLNMIILFFCLLMPEYCN